MLKFIQYNIELMPPYHLHFEIAQLPQALSDLCAFTSAFLYLSNFSDLMNL